MAEKIRVLVGVDLGEGYKENRYDPVRALDYLFQAYQSTGFEFGRMFNSLGQGSQEMQHRIEQGTREAQEAKETVRLELEFALGKGVRQASKAHVDVLYRMGAIIR